MATQSKKAVLYRETELKCACVAGGDGIVDDHENLSAVTTMEGAEMHAEQDESFYNVRSLRRCYGIGRHEAERLLQRFGNSKQELDLLLSARGRTPRHRPKELATLEQRAPFGIG
ncbi:hypothetical protein [Rhizobium phaseoli]|nr:hypothetical protein [Rhizobium phaseoli]